MQYEDLGGRGDQLLFAHANGFPPLCYRRLLTRFAEHYHVLAMDQRPLWRPPPGADSMRNWDQPSGDLIDFVERHMRPPVVGVGHSMGGAAVLLAADRRPDLFRSIALIDPIVLLPWVIALMRFSPMRARRRLPFVRLARTRRHHWASLQDVFDTYRSKAVFERIDDEGLWDYAEHSTEPARGGGRRLRYPREWEAHMYCMPPSPWAALRRQRVPAVGVFGSHSAVMRAPVVRRWRRAWTRGPVLEIEGCSHLVPLEAPELVARAILEKLGHGRPPPRGE